MKTKSCKTLKSFVQNIVYQIQLYWLIVFPSLSSQKHWLSIFVPLEWAQSQTLSVLAARSIWVMLFLCPQTLSSALFPVSPQYWGWLLFKCFTVSILKYFTLSIFKCFFLRSKRSVAHMHIMLQIILLQIGA